MNKEYIFTEGCQYNKEEVPNHLPVSDYFSYNKITKKLTPTMCGIILTNDNNNYFFFPKGYLVNDNKKTANLLLNVLKKYGYTQNKNIGFGETEVNLEKSHFFSVVDWLINDFFENDIYKEMEDIHEVNGKGRPLWAKTIKSKSPFISDKQVFYPEILTNKRTFNDNYLITQIHHNIIYECLIRFGWIYGASKNINPINLLIPIEQQTIVLKKKIRETNVSREIRLLKMLVEYLTESQSGLTSKFQILTSEFEYIWETMLQEVFKNDNDLKTRLPRPYWLRNEFDGISYTSQRPDIIVQFKDVTMILDAKYYSISNSENVKTKYPGGPDIIKQIFYRLTLEKKIGDKKLQNIFIFPRSVRNEQIQYLGKSSIEYFETDYGYIFAYALDIDMVMRAYVKNHYLHESLVRICEEVKTLSESNSNA